MLGIGPSTPTGIDAPEFATETNVTASCGLAAWSLSAELRRPGDGRAVGVRILGIHCRVGGIGPLRVRQTGHDRDPSPEAYESPIETMRTSFTWILTIAIRASATAPRSPAPREKRDPEDDNEADG